MKETSDHIVCSWSCRHFFIDTDISDCQVFTRGLKRGHCYSKLINISVYLVPGSVLFAVYHGAANNKNRGNENKESINY